MTCCPKSLLTADLLEFFEDADLVEVALPVGGGLLDQTASFRQGLRVLRKEEAHWRETAKGK